MRYLIASLVGLGTGLLAAVLWIVIRFVLPIAIPLLNVRLGLNPTGGVGAGVAYISSGSILVAALIGFVAGLAWWLWRG